MIAHLLSYGFGIVLLALLEFERAWVLVPAGLLSGVGIFFTRREKFLPWSRLVAWTSTVAGLAVASGPSPLDFSLQEAVAASLGLSGIVAGLHVPTFSAAPQQSFKQVVLWTLLVFLVAAVSWVPWLDTVDQELAVLDRSTVAGMAVRLVVISTVILLAAVGRHLLRMRSRNGRGETLRTPPTPLVATGRPASAEP